MKKSTHHPRLGIVGAGLSGLRIAADLAAAAPHAEITIWDQGPAARVEHEGWDQRTHPGDTRRPHTPSTRTLWGAQSGLKARAGGRSLCWHGQLLPIEPYALAHWPPVWQDRLPPLAQALLDELAPPPGSTGTGWPSYGIRPVRQAAELAAGPSGAVQRWRAYSPLQTVLAHPRIQIRPGAPITHVQPRAGGVQVYGGGAPAELDVCILAAGAIGNAAILAQSLGQTLRVPLCDHICAGAVMSFRGDTPTRPALLGDATLVGYTAAPGLQANLFFQERPQTNDGLRTLDAWVLAEQTPDSASTLICTPQAQGAASIAIEPRLTEPDRARTEAALAQAIATLERIAGPARRVTSAADEPHAIQHAQTHPGEIARYERPLGCVDHEACTHAIGALCTAELDVPGLPGVLLSGPGVFPRAGAANPGLAILAIASWLARSVQARLA